MDRHPALQRSHRWPAFATWILPPCVVLVFIWLALGGTTWNAHLPFAYSGDTLFYLAQSKSTLDHGWWWYNPSLGAPLGLHAAAFAQNTNVDQAFVRVVGLFTREAGLAINVAWLIIVALSAVTATWGLRRLGASRLAAGVAGVLFALCPYAFYRNTAHFNVVTYLLPFPATIALLLASIDRNHRWRARELALPLAGCAFVGFDYIYFAFFSAFVVATGALIGAARMRSVAPLGIGALCLGVLVLATAINVVPNVIAWRQYGQPTGVVHTPVESEVYGLKIRHLVSPTPSHWFAPFKAWTDRDAAAEFPNENENKSARLGLVAAAGFLGLLAALLFPAAPGREGATPRMRGAALLTVATLFLALVGGFGSLFSLLVSSDIRAYNRISPFITFFALAAVALWGDRLMRSQSRGRRTAFWIALLCVGLADQQPAIRRLTVDLPRIEAEVGRVRTFMAPIESQLPDNAMVYQLPVRPYPLDSGVEKLGVYTQFRPYLVTEKLRWSYPALTPDQLLWESRAAKVADLDLPRFLAREGFSVILISRAGYQDRGLQIQQRLMDAGVGATMMATSDDYVALDLRPLRAAVAR